MRNAKVVFSFTAGSILLTGLLVSSSATPARCGDSKAVVSAPNRLIANSKLPTPQAGLKLLLGIFNRMGNEPQLAKNEKKQQAKEVIAFQGQNLTQSQLFQNATDPALMIRPQEKNKAASKPIPIQGMNIAMAPTGQDGYMSGFSSSQGEPHDKSGLSSNTGIWESESAGAKKVSGTVSGSRSSYLPPATLGRSNAAPGAALAAKDQERGLSNESKQRLSKSLGNLAGIVNRMQEAQQMPSKIAVVPRQQSGGYYGGGAGAGGTVEEISTAGKNIKTYNAPRGGVQIMDESPVVRDYRTIDTNAGNTAANRLIAHKAPRVPSPVVQAEALAEEGTVKLDQPSAFKYNREYGEKAFPSTDADDNLSNWGAAPKRKEAKERSDSYKSAEIAKPADSKASIKREAESRRAREIIAYAPPSVVTGIPGLTLGSSEYETNRFLANRGDVMKETITPANGGERWKVWSLRTTGSQEPALQVYIRGNQVQGLRIFDRNLTPPGLGVSLGDGLVRMKEKFGEPAFVLQEPTNQGGKNYVYPVSQVGFQLAKPVSGETAPKVVSLLLFKFN